MCSLDDHDYQKYICSAVKLDILCLLLRGISSSNTSEHPKVKPNSRWNRTYLLTGVHREMHKTYM